MGKINPSWEIHAKCKCGWHAYLAFGDFFYFDSSIGVSCCPKCGADRPDGHHYDFSHNWERVRIKWISFCVWYKPWTWWAGKWEEMPETKS